MIFSAANSLDGEVRRDGAATTSIQIVETEIGKDERDIILRRNGFINGLEQALGFLFTCA